jgi:hypothetical protein
MMYLLVLLFACEKMDNPGTPLERISLERLPSELSTEEIPDEVASLEVVDPAFVDPQDEIIMMGTEEPAEDAVAVSEETDVEEVVAPIEQIEEVVHTDRRPARVKDGWLPILVSTLTESPIPRAVLVMPGGAEVVVRAGDLLQEEGVIVMSIGDGAVELAAITAESGQAQIENISLSAQYPE